MPNFTIQHIMARVILYLALWASVLVPILAASYAAQEPLKTLRAREAEERRLAAETRFTGQTCGTSIRPRIDWSSVPDSWPSGVSIVKSCDGALGALETICRGDQSRGKKVTSFVCAGDSDGPSLSGSTLRYGASPGDNGFNDTKALLDSEL